MTVGADISVASSHWKTCCYYDDETSAAAAW